MVGDGEEVGEVSDVWEGGWMEWGGGGVGTVR